MFLSSPHLPFQIQKLLLLHNSSNLFPSLFIVLSLDVRWIVKLDCWLVGCFGFSGPLRQYFSLYRAVSQREGERGEKG